MRSSRRLLIRAGAGQQPAGRCGEADFLGLEQSEALIALQLRLKAAFDPKGLLNPHKIFPRKGHGSC